MLLVAAFVAAVSSVAASNIANADGATHVLADIVGYFD